MYFRKSSRMHYAIMPSTPVPVIFLKTQSQPNDPYEDYFTSEPYPYRDGFLPVPFQSTFVPVLQHRHVNLDRLQEAIVAPVDVTADGLIITSQRAAEALGAVLSLLKANPEHSTIVADFLGRTKVYVVGPATFDAITALGFCEDKVLGKDCGNGDALAQFILDEYQHMTKRKPLLFLVGDNHRDIIPKTLTGAPELQRVNVNELVIYETTIVSDFREKFRDVIGQELATGKRDQLAGGIRWVVVFSPTGADIALGELQDRTSLEQNGWQTLIACIGPTTQRHLESKLQKKPDVVAAKPTPSALWNAITQCMREKLEK